jgi:hypothetical protein
LSILQAAVLGLVQALGEFFAHIQFSASYLGPMDFRVSRPGANVRCCPPHRYTRGGDFLFQEGLVATHHNSYHLILFLILEDFLLSCRRSLTVMRAICPRKMTEKMGSRLSLLKHFKIYV